MGLHAWLSHTIVFKQRCLYVVKKIYKKAEESTFICILSSSLSSQDISICLKKWAVFVVVRYIIVLCWARQSLHQIL